MARDEFANEHPESDMHIYIVDSHSYSMVYGDALIEAAKKLDGGADVKSVLDYLEDHFACAEVVLSMYNAQFCQKERTHQRSGGLCRRAAGVKAHHYDY